AAGLGGAGRGPRTGAGADGSRSDGNDRPDRLLGLEESDDRRRAAETLGHYADWLHVSTGRLRKLNHLHRRSAVVMGRHIKLDFHRVSPDVFEAKRREYHRSLEASYFAVHRIAGTQVYIARRGDSLWTVTHRYDQLPIWLIEQCNPDVDFGDM